MFAKLVCGIFGLWLCFGVAAAEPSFKSRVLNIKQTKLMINELRFASYKPRQTSSWLSAIARSSACVSLYLAEIIASQPAEFELTQFRRGDNVHAVNLYLADSQALQELLAGDYYQELVDYLVLALADWYQGKIPAEGGVFMQAVPYRVFGGKDFLWELVDGIDMADIVGSITYYARLTTENGMITIELTNVMSLESYAGSNYFRHNLVENPKQGAFSSTYQIFRWQLPIPLKYLQ